MSGLAFLFHPFPEPEMSDRGGAIGVGEAAESWPLSIRNAEPIAINAMV
jgi:hypothetical protein